MIFGLSTGALIVLLITILLGFYMAWTIGANDVANSMGTVFGSKSLSLKKIILIAVIFEFLGAFLVGAHVTKTLKAGIVDPTFFSNGEYFSSDHGLYLFIAGMSAVLLSSSLWVTLATYKSLPISTSQSIVGAVTGFGLVCVLVGDIPSRALHLDTLIEISIGWVLSPIFGGLISFLIFILIKKLIFDSDRPVDRAKKLIPIFIFLVFTILVMAGLSGGLKNLQSALEQILPGTMVRIILGDKLLKALLSVLVGLIAALVGTVIIKKKVRDRKNQSYDRVERMFGILLILTACYVAFAHGANDVANAIGPVAAILHILTTNEVSTTVEINPLILILGGLGIVAGVATWGYKVMATIGKKITNITPTRGFTASFGAASSVLICSFLGIPVSTSQIIVGAVIGVGLAGGISAIDMRIVRNIFFTWIVTIPVAGITTGIIFLIIRAIMINIL
ncbi:MAG: inorganic phosphate transporter [Thermoplasmatota archaeon]